jgi:hypothetical protein
MADIEDNVITGSRAIEDYSAYFTAEIKRISITCLRADIESDSLVKSSAKKIGIMGVAFTALGAYQHYNMKFDDAVVNDVFLLTTAVIGAGLIAYGACQYFSSARQIKKDAQQIETQERDLERIVSPPPYKSAIQSLGSKEYQVQNQKK